jgi:hypothetical protein
MHDLPFVFLMATHHLPSLVKIVTNTNSFKKQVKCELSGPVCLEFMRRVSCLNLERKNKPPFALPQFCATFTP